MKDDWKDSLLKIKDLLASTRLKIEKDLTEASDALTEIEQLLSELDSVWIKWNGGPSPLAPNRIHKRRYRDGVEGNWTSDQSAGSGLWKHFGADADIVAYQLMERV